MCQSLFAEVIDPEAHIMRLGYLTMEKIDGGKKVFYSAVERSDSPRIISLEIDIGKLPKHPNVKIYCDRLAAGIRAKLIAEQGPGNDVVATNYGNNGYTLACVLKYKEVVNFGRQTTFSTQLTYFKDTRSAQYMVTATD
jgi:hypothetical protein